MTESPITSPEAVQPPVEKTSRLQSFRVNHPRTAKVVGIVALTAGVLTAVNVVKSRNKVVVSTEPRADGEPLIETSSETS